ncbi:Putative amidase domain-containing protein [Evansella caseinilytica]|uniref:Putative amidase domain-containing protein n=1 Tax=Evansella caseinilytica TaxID=1503961 RepID=A0A1H3R2M0_9BACI|nr:amidase domain-containing protein [Evansella caseinilytica]SDZ19555.1 Putative amidase domain-containing protein [Evansella caseinilytica]
MGSLMKELLKYVQVCQRYFISPERTPAFIREAEMAAMERKQQSLANRKAEVVKNIVEGRIINKQAYYERTLVDYLITVQNLIRHPKKMYMEEQVQTRRAIVEDGELIDDYLVSSDGEKVSGFDEWNPLNNHETVRSSPNYTYDRLAVVKYAERWWNEFNPSYRRFENDCTNFVSQCMKAGGAPMVGKPDRAKGWWYTGKSWSYSWTVAHALRWYLSGGKSGLQASEVQRAEELMIGDIICYDFTGDDHWQHTTVVVAKDGEEQPLVNAHTANSRMRYWAYEDSTAWTPNIQYKFFHIIDKHS